jgi:hypothetical protein
VERVGREEFLRFALLVVLTIGLASVAFRIDSSPSARSSGPPAHAAPPAASHATAPASGAAPQVLPTEATRAPGQRGGSPVAAVSPILPVTGWDGAVKLLACACVLIGTGVSLRGLGTSQPR